jgi:acetylglutamate kinase
MGRPAVNVLKVGGRQLDEPLFLDGLAQLIADFPEPPLLVHGGGKGTSALSQRLGLEARFVDGQRVTDEATREAAICGLAGLAKLQLLPALLAQGVKALGLCGVDAGLVRCRKLPHAQDLGWVGQPSSVRVQELRDLQQAGFVVCLSPLCLGEDGQIYNVNADSVAAAVASALAAQQLIFLTDVNGVQGREGRIPRLNKAEFDKMVAQAEIGAGMLPKLQGCFTALEQGVKEVLITDLAGCRAWLSGHREGTVIVGG